MDSDKLTAFCYDMDKSMTLLRQEFTYFKEEIAPAMTQINCKLDRIQDELNEVRIRHAREDEALMRKRNFWSFVLKNWKFLSVIFLTFFTLLFAGYELATNLHDSIPKEVLEKVR